MCIRDRNISGTPPCSGSFAVKVNVASEASPTAPAAGNSLTPAASPAAAQPTAASPETQKPAQDIKSKLASAAQVFLAGQFGTVATASTTSAPAAPAGN